MKLETRQDVYDLFGGVEAAAMAMDVTRQAIFKWPEPLTNSQIDRVVGAAVRLKLIVGCNAPKQRKVS